MILAHLLKLTEAEKKKSDQQKSTKLKDKDDEPDLSAFTRTKTDQPIANRKPDGKKDVKGDETGKAKHLKTASKEKTSSASRNVSMDDDSMKHLANLHKNMPKGEEGSEAEPETPSTEVVVHKANDVPAVVSDKMVAAGFVDPDFHTVANLPGNMSSAIRQLGKSLFGVLTDTATNNVSMVGNLGGMGPNSPKEVNSVAAYLKKHGEDLGAGEIDFDKIMPGYKAKIHNFAADGVHFMLVKDQMGDYIYAWPEKDTKHSKATGRLGNDTKKLK